MHTGCMAWKKGDGEFQALVDRRVALARWAAGTCGCKNLKIRWCMGGSRGVHAGCMRGARWGRGAREVHVER